ncbi:uncharacterized protein BJ212DRAFT_1475674 [Suillus subaureus]|uniref:Uncharacterized protein n=1 Tax=Suillus subaureus TaxID=48587 RepID=A0A9P7JI04_9AGAM|nr:uncharacterized protein BJ212DRAFT_1475674 [Suillus subaureus]KAG1824364.1 hypothetical protein BJ212DRAFT_1475674 [Suillus subaureus]
MPTRHSKWSASSKKSEKGVKGGLRNGKREGRGRRNGVTKDARLVSQEDVAVERTTMLLERQAELDQIMDTHDAMVREAFHLEKFVTLIEYDPTIAKQDKSIVFQEYKSDYDLLEKASTSAGPSRATRRAHTERVQNLTAPLLPSTTSRVRTEPELPLSAKSKGKQKAVDSVNGTAPIESVTPNKPGKSKSISQPPKLRALAPILPMDGEASISTGPVRGKKRNITVVSPTGSPAAAPSAKKKRKFQDGLASEVAEVPNILGHKSTGSDDVALDPSQISARRKSLRHPPAMIREPPTLFQLPSEVEPPQSQFNIRRVKLIVRPPPPLYSNPRQQPPRPRFIHRSPAF